MNCKYCKDKLVKGDNANNDSDVICVECSEEGYSIWVNSTVKGDVEHILGDKKEELFNCHELYKRHNASIERKKK